MTDDEKLKRIRKMIEEWSEQPDPGPGEDDSPEAADVLFQILELIS